MDFETEGYNVEQDGRQPEGEAVRQLSFQQNQQVGELQRQANDKEVAKAFAKQATSMPRLDLKNIRSETLRTIIEAEGRLVDVLCYHKCGSGRSLHRCRKGRSHGNGSETFVGRPRMKNNDTSC